MTYVAEALARRPPNNPVGRPSHKSADIAYDFPAKRNFIVWLDYTDTDRKAQLQEAEQTLIRLKHGDIFRITMNADIRNLKQGPAGGSASRDKFRAEYLRGQIEDMMPTAITEITDQALPSVLAACLEIAAQKAKAQVPHLEFTPLLITSYADGQRMLTVTCGVSEIAHEERFPNPQFRRWKFAARNWQDIQDIAVPVLSARERFRLDGNLKKSAKKMLAALRFFPAEDEPSSLIAVSNYKKFQRFYPAFRHVDD
jgi:hypothetical protein